jgi:hypothetical protein
VLALVPVATNTRHWKQYVFGAATAVAFLYDTRLRFLVEGKDGGKGAPMSCAMVYWGPQYERFEKTFIRFGAVVDVRHLHGRPVGVGEHPTLFESAENSNAVSQALLDASSTYDSKPKPKDESVLTMSGSWEPRAARLDLLEGRTPDFQRGAE